MKLKKLASLALAGALTLGLLPAFSSPALAGVVTTTDYVLTIPSSLTVTKSGWNEQTDGITAKLSSGDAFDDSKKLTVTAASNNKDTNAEYEWKLVSDTNTVGYNLAASGDDSSSYNSTATPASWEFSASEITTTGTKKTLGIIVEDYSSKPAGTYTDTVTFTASVEDNLVSFTIMRDVNKNSSGNYTVAPGTTWQQFIESGNAPACLSINQGKVWHDMNNSISDCGGTLIANTADKKHVKPDDAIIDGATYACSDYLGYQDHD